MALDTRGGALTMFIISKIIWFLTQPSSLMALGILIGIVCVWRGRQRAGLRWLIGSLATMMIVGLTAVADIITAPLEARFPRPDLAGQQIAGIIVLGGAEDPSGGTRELMSLNEAAERMTEAAALARRLPNATIVFSGGSGALLREHVSAAAQASNFFQAMGIAANRIVLENQSRTTHENALYSRDVLKPKAGERYLIVTSAWHMPRAIGSYRAQGFDAVAWSVDYRTPGHFSALRTFGAFPDGLRRTDAIVKEYVGLIAYRLAGRTSALFPAP